MISKSTKQKRRSQALNAGTRLAQWGVEGMNWGYGPLKEELRVASARLMTQPHKLRLLGAWASQQQEGGWTTPTTEEIIKLAKEAA